jgi:hypothetical protein
MKKPVLFSLIVIVIIAAIGSGIYFVGQKQKTKINPKAEALAPSPTPKIRLTWNDPAGFTFSYDPDVKINKHDEDEVNYAHVEITNQSFPGTIIIWAKDTTALDSSAWANTQKEFKNASIIDTTFGGQPGKKVVITSPIQKMITGAVYDNLLFYIEKIASNDAYWQQEYVGITDSFTFKPVDNTGIQNESEQNNNDENQAVDEEEVVE